MDFKYLTDPEDWLAFFANLFNTLYIHAIFGIGTVFDMHVHVFANTSCYVVGMWRWEGRRGRRGVRGSGNWRHGQKSVDRAEGDGKQQ